MSSYYEGLEINEEDSASGVCICVSGYEYNGIFLCVFRLWFDELMNLWMSVQNQPSWEGVSTLFKYCDTYFYKLVLGN